MKITDIFKVLKARPNRSPKDAPIPPTSMWVTSSRRNIVQYGNAVAAEKALEHPIIFRCLHKLGTSVQQVQWYAEADPDVPASERANATTIKALNALLKSPNDALAPDQLRYWMTLAYAVFGRVPFKVGVGVEKLPTGIYPLDARYLQSVTDERGLIKGYTYSSSAPSSGVFDTRRVAERAGHTKGYAHEIYTPNLSASLECGKNITALAAIGMPSDIITKLMQRAYDAACGHPNTKYIVTAEKTLTERQKQAIKDHVEESGPGGDESGNILFLSNTEVKVHPLNNDLSDIHSKMPSDDMARMICGAFGIPISLIGLGAADGAKFAGNYKESRQSFWEDTIVPGYLTPFQTGLTAALCPPGARIRFDLDTIDAIQDSRATRAANLERVTFMTNDEKREIAGFAPLTEEQRRILESEAAARKPSTPVATQPTSNENP